jgi:hypothetical protein
MTRDEIIDMAREADIDWHKNWNDDGSNRLEHLAALIAARVAAAEREACAKLADSMDPLQDGAIGNAIRARGKA